MHGAIRMSGTTVTSTLPEIPAETRIRDEARDQRQADVFERFDAAKKAESLDREAILRAREARPAVLIGPVVMGASLSLGIRLERENPDRDS